MGDKKTKGHVVVNIEECKGCGLCVEACPVNVLYQSEKFNTRGYHYAQYKGDGCTGCGICFYSCPEPGAITVFKRWDKITEKRFGNKLVNIQFDEVFTLEDKPGKYFCTACLKEV